MTEMFRVTPIEGKGFGIVATKFIKMGTLILKEEPQIPYVGWPTLMKVDLWKRCIKTLIKLFYQMSEPDQEEYLKLHNRYEGELFVDECFTIFCRAVMAEEKDKQKAAKILKICGIYQTNQCADGLKIKTSRFNHSCFPNATTNKNDKGIYATYDIKEGEEITINYTDPAWYGESFWSMRKKVNRQKILDEMGFTCLCDLCKKQDESPTDVNQTEIESKIEDLIEEIKKLDFDRCTELQYPPDKCRRHIECYKQLYKLGRERKAHRYDLYKILQRSFQDASYEYQFCFNRKMFKEMEEFKKESINFAKSAEGFAKFLGEAIVQPESWREIQQNFKRSIMLGIFQM